MELIGMLDSPYVRRVAIGFQLLGLRFDHQPVSVFRAFDAFSRINPVVKAPTLVCDDGTVLMDSTLILNYGQTLAGPRRALLPTGAAALATALRTVGLALAACEKSVQIVYEHNVRPADKLHAPWVERITGQLLQAYRALESDLARRPLPVTTAAIGQDGVDVAVAWEFTQQLMPERVPRGDFPALNAHAQRAEALPAFLAAPYGSGTYRAAG